MNRSILISGLSALALTVASATNAQRSAKVYRIGYLAAGAAAADASRREALREGLGQLGYIEGKNITIEARYAEGRLDQLEELAKELVRLKVDVIVAGGATTIRGARKATNTIPIIMSNVSDPVELNLIPSLSRPGGNITGLMTRAAELGGRRLELLKEVVPQLSRVAVLGGTDNQLLTVQMKDVEIAARRLAVELQTITVQGAEDLTASFAGIKKNRPGAILGLQNPILAFLRRQVAQLANQNLLPSIFPDLAFPEAGALMAFGPDYNDLSRRAAIYVDKILKGADPGQLAVEGPTKFNLVINLKTAKLLRLDISPALLKRADRIIK
jgi:putative tryptophan/tyrosine transport system substrate-binding protein